MKEVLTQDRKQLHPKARIMHSNNAFDLIRFMAALGGLISNSFPTIGQHETTYYAGKTLGSLSVMSIIHI